jgi:phosphoribosylamine--glycine ligase
MVVGSGGREHALSVRLLESASVAEVMLCPGNAGTAAGAAGKPLGNRNGAPLDVARAERPDLVVVGPEAPLCAGLADELRELGMTCYGPSRAAAVLEGSKAFMKEFASRHGIATAPFVVVEAESALERALAEFASAPVVKADGLCAGKGVVVAETRQEARLAALEMLRGERFGDAGRRIVLEERVRGAEASLHAICDGERCFVLPPAQDHKRIGDGDTGPNTGGMGAYAPAPVVDAPMLDHARQHVFEPIVRGMAEEGRRFVGTLFANLMLVPGREPTLLEINVRFGDPETQVLTRIVDGDWGEALLGAARGRLDRGSLSVAERHALCVVVAAQGYPVEPRLGAAIDGIAEAEADPAVRVFHAGTRAAADRVVSSGGRVLGVTATGATLSEAHRAAYRGVECIRFDGMQYRRDIGASALGAA